MELWFGVSNFTAYLNTKKMYIKVKITSGTECIININMISSLIASRDGGTVIAMQDVNDTFVVDIPLEKIENLLIETGARVFDCVKS